MARQNRLTSIAVLLLLFFTTTALASTPLYCKCICGKQSKIIFLREGTCSTCTRQYCHSYNLMECKGYEDKEGEHGIVTECFQRDSVKDRVVVMGFLVVTTGLLLWAMIRGSVGKWTDRGRSSPTAAENTSAYSPVGPR